VILAFLFGAAFGVGVTVLLVGLGRAARLGDEQTRVRSIIVVDTPENWPRGTGYLEIDGEPMEVVTVPREAPE
jgi:hypothetical protein